MVFLSEHVPHVVRELATYEAPVQDNQFFIKLLQFKEFYHSKVIFKQGDESDGIYFILSGEVSLHVKQLYFSGTNEGEPDYGPQIRVLVPVRDCPVEGHVSSPFPDTLSAVPG